MPRFAARELGKLLDQAALSASPADRFVRIELVLSANGHAIGANVTPVESDSPGSGVVYRRLHANTNGYSVARRLLQELSS